MISENDVNMYGVTEFFKYKNSVSTHFIFNLLFFVCLLFLVRIRKRYGKIVFRLNNRPLRDVAKSSGGDDEDDGNNNLITRINRVTSTGFYYGRIGKTHRPHTFYRRWRRVGRFIDHDEEACAIVSNYVESEVDTSMSAHVDKYVLDQVDTIDNHGVPADEGFPQGPSDHTLLTLFYDVVN